MQRRHHIDRDRDIASRRRINSQHAQALVRARGRIFSGWGPRI